MNREIINPWQWQEKYGFVHGNKVTHVESILYVAGQTAVDDDGVCLHAGDMKAQLDRVIANIETVLRAANMDFTNVVRLTVYTVDMPGIIAVHDHMAHLLQSRGCRHAGTLLGVTALADPRALVEIEVTAAA